MSTRSVDEVTQDVARALRDPNLTEVESAAVASLVVLKRCTLQQARAALEQCREMVGSERLNGDHATLVACMSGFLLEGQRRRVVVRPCRYGPATNVIDCWFKQNENRYLHKGELVATVMSAYEVRGRIKQAWRNMVSNRAVSNDNDPDLEESPRFFSKVQSAWVAERSRARA